MYYVYKRTNGKLWCKVPFGCEVLLNEFPSNAFEVVIV